MNFYSHKAFRADLRCCGCNAHIVWLRRVSRWRGNTVSPVCADANLAFIGSEKS